MAKRNRPEAKTSEPTGVLIPYNAMDGRPTVAKAIDKDMVEDEIERMYGRGYETASPMQVMRWILTELVWARLERRQHG